MARSKRIGVLTSGGDCPGLNAVIRAVVKRAVSRLGWEVYGIRDAFNGLLSQPYRVEALTRDSVRGILTRGGTILGTSNRGDPFKFPIVGPIGVTTLGDRSGDVVEAMRILELEGLIVIGGDGSLKIAHRLSQDHGVKIVAVPKTIDNDIGATDSTFGFNTAVEVATDAIDRLHSTAESHDRVMLVEVMGRDAGWIALHSGIQGGADVILVPEIPYEIGAIVDKIQRRKAAGRRYSLIVVAEGARPQGGEPSYLEKKPSAGMPRLGGAAERLAGLIGDRCGLETRVTVLGHLLRGGRPSGYDRLLATRYGVAAVGLVKKGAWGRMVALKGTQVKSVPIEEAIRAQKRIEPDDEIVGVARELGIELGDSRGG